MKERAIVPSKDLLQGLRQSRKRARDGWRINSAPIVMQDDGGGGAVSPAMSVSTLGGAVSRSDVANEGEERN